MEKPELSRGLFWETNFEKIDWKKKDAYVIERVVSYGQMKDWEEIQSFYGLERIKEVVLDARYLDDKTLHFVSFFFNIPIEEFRCYKHRQSVPQLYPY